MLELLTKENSSMKNDAAFTSLHFSLRNLIKLNWNLLNQMERFSSTGPVDIETAEELYMSKLHTVCPALQFINGQPLHVVFSRWSKLLACTVSPKAFFACYQPFDF